MPYEYIKLHRSFFTGTMHSEAAYTKLLFLAMLIECTDGVIVATNDYLCRFTNLKPEAVERALEALQLPDANSTSIEEDGRRIVAVPFTRNTYRIVNWAKYQPALSSDWKDKPGLTVVDPDTGEKVERLLPDGSKNPKYQKLYQRAYRKFQKDREAATAALEAELSTIGVNPVNSVNGSGSDGHGREQGGGSPGPKEPESDPLEPEREGENVNFVNSVNKRKEKETKENHNNPPKPPRTRKPAGSTKALAKGDPKNADTFALFDEAYPRPSNGRKLERADARLTWDLLAEAGEDMAKIIEGAKRYGEWVEQLRKHEYVAMMTTWLNQRRWEESYFIHPDSEEGRKIAARREAEANERKALHVAKFKSDYERYIQSLAEEAADDQEFIDSWREEAEARLARRKTMGMAKATEMAQAVLDDPATGREDRIRTWKERNAETLPKFWDWDRDMNPERFEG